MSTLLERKAKISKHVRIFMEVGRLTIDPASHEWINPTTRVEVPGVVLRLKDGEGYAELNLENEADAKIYKRFKEWIAEGKDTRILTFNVYELKPGKASKPFPWWDTTKADKLMDDVERSVAAMSGEDERIRFLDHCVLYEGQKDTPRKSLIKSLETLDLSGAVAVVDELAVPE